MRTPLLYEPDTGRLYCDAHAHRGVRDAIAKKPNAKSWPLPGRGRVKRWTEADDAFWIQEFGHPADCEDCEFTAATGQPS